jgi:hypothetical protein
VKTSPFPGRASPRNCKSGHYDRVCYDLNRKKIWYSSKWTTCEFISNNRAAEYSKNALRARVLNTITSNLICRQVVVYVAVEQERVHGGALR